MNKWDISCGIFGYGSSELCGMLNIMAEADSSSREVVGWQVHYKDQQIVPTANRSWNQLH